MKCINDIRYSPVIYGGVNISFQVITKFSIDSYTLIMDVIQIVMFQRPENEYGRSQTESKNPDKKYSTGSSNPLQNIFRWIDDQLVAIKSNDCNRYRRYEYGDGLEAAGRFAAQHGIPDRPVVIKQLDECERHRHQA